MEDKNISSKITKEESSKISDDNNSISDNLMNLFICNEYNASQFTLEQVLESLGGTETYDNIINKTVYYFNSPETVQDAVKSVIEKYLTEADSLSWFNETDSFISDNELKPGETIFGYVTFSPIRNIYFQIEDDWLEENKERVGNKLEDFKKNLDDFYLKLLPDNYITDGFILNFGNKNVFGERWANGELTDFKNSWNDFVDDIFLLYVAINLYVALRIYGDVKVYNNGDEEIEPVAL